MIFDCTGIQKETIMQLAAGGEDDRVLDVGCGDGEKTFFVAQQVGAAVGFDPDGASVRSARTRYKKENLQFLVGQAEALCFADDSFDAVMFNESLHHVPAQSQLRALQEGRRVLRPGGKMLILEPVRGRGASGKILKIFNEETESSLSAIKAIESAIGNGFRLTFKDEIRPLFSCSGLDELYAYCTASHPDEQWSDAYKKEIERRLDRCERHSNGDFLIDYFDTVWLLVKE